MFHRAKGLGGVRHSSGRLNICREEMSCITVMRDKETLVSMEGKIGRNDEDGNRKPKKQGSSEKEHKRTEDP